MFVTKTKITGEVVLVNHDSIAAVIEWAKFHNLRFVEAESELRYAVPSFIAQRADAEPLGDGALNALRHCRWTPTPQAPHEFYGIGEGHAAIANSGALKGESNG